MLTLCQTRFVIPKSLKTRCFHQRNTSISDVKRTGKKTVWYDGHLFEKRLAKCVRSFIACGNPTFAIIRFNTSTANKDTTAQILFLVCELERNPNKAFLYTPRCKPPRETQTRECIAKALTWVPKKRVYWATSYVSRGKSLGTVAL